MHPKFPSCLTEQEQVQLNEGCLFRVHIDADWLETDVIAIEFRLLTAPLPENEPAPTEETSPTAVPPQEPTPAKLKEVCLTCSCRASNA